MKEDKIIIGDFTDIIEEHRKSVIDYAYRKKTMKQLQKDERLLIKEIVKASKASTIRHIKATKFDKKAVMDKTSSPYTYEAVPTTAIDLYCNKLLSNRKPNKNSMFKKLTDGLKRFKKA